MADDCRDCDRPTGDVPPEFDGRCPDCHKAFLARQKEARKAAKESPASPGEE